jgi:hypothetical protein
MAILNYPFRRRGDARRELINVLNAVFFLSFSIIKHKPFFCKQGYGFFRFRRLKKRGKCGILLAEINMMERKQFMERKA